MQSPGDWLLELQGPEESSVDVPNAQMGTWRAREGRVHLASRRECLSWDKDPSLLAPTPVFLSLPPKLTRARTLGSGWQRTPGCGIHA